MAFRLLRPSVGAIRVQPQESYEGTTNRYASELQSALRSQENATINNKLRAFEEGSMSFKSLLSYLNDLRSKYPKDSTRYVDIQNTITDARKFQIRTGDTRLQNDLLEQYGSDVSEGELRAMWDKRMANARANGAPKYDPEFWNSLLTGRAEMENRLARAAGETAADKALDEIRLEISQNESEYQAGRMTGAEKDFANYNLSKSLYESGKMNATEIAAFIQYSRDLTDRDITVDADGKGTLGNNGILSDVVTQDENGRTEVKAATLESLKSDRYEARPTPDGDWAVYDNLTGLPKPGSTYSSQGEKGKGAQGYAQADADALNSAGHDFLTPTGIVHGVWDESQKAWKMDVYDANGSPTGNYTYTASPAYGVGEARTVTTPEQKTLGEQIKEGVSGTVEAGKAAVGELGKRYEKNPQGVALETALMAGAATKVLPTIASAILKFAPWVARFGGGVVSKVAGLLGKTLPAIGKFALPYEAASEIVGSSEIIRRMATLKTPEEQEKFIRELSPLSISGLGAKGAFALRKPLETGGINKLIQGGFNFLTGSGQFKQGGMGLYNQIGMPQPWIYKPVSGALTKAEDTGYVKPEPGLKEALKGSYIDEQGQLKFR